MDPYPNTSKNCGKSFIYPTVIKCDNGKSTICRWSSKLYCKPPLFWGFPSGPPRLIARGYLWKNWDWTFKFREFEVLENWSRTWWNFEELEFGMEYTIRGICQGWLIRIWADCSKNNMDLTLVKCGIKNDGFHLQRIGNDLHPKGCKPTWSLVLWSPKSWILPAPVLLFPVKQDVSWRHRCHGCP